MNIFITGASGFVGGAAAKALVAAGHNVLAMSRRDASDKVITELGATPVRCSLEDVSAGHMADCDVVIHSAAHVLQWGEPDSWYKSNVLGTKAVLAAAQAAGVKRFVHIGTEAGIVYGQHVRAADETYPLCPSSPYPYCATKAQAEQCVIAANSAELTTIVLRPRLIWGPGDQTLLPVIKEMSQRGNWTWINHGKARTSTIYIDNLVHAIELALTNGNGGEAYYIVDDGDISLFDMITKMAASQQLTLANKNIPMWLADSVGWLCEGIWRLLKLKNDPPLTRHAAMVMSRDCTLVADKAKRELGYQPVVSREQGFAVLSGE